MYIAIDVGGTKTLVCSTEKISKDELPVIGGELRFGNENNFETDFEKLTETINTLAAGSKLEGISIGIPGVLDEQQEMIVSSANLSDWEGNNIKKLLADKFMCKVAVGHDVSAGALGEIVYGVKENLEDIYFIAWGTGIGGSLISKGSAKTVEFGWQFVNSEYLELLVGGASLEKRFSKKAEDLTDLEWSEVINDLAQGINNVVAITGVKKFIIGGGVGIKQSSRIKELENATNKILADIGTVTIQGAKLGEMAAIYGLFARLKDNV